MQDILHIPRGWDHPAPGLKRLILLLAGILAAEGLVVLVDQVFRPTFPILLLALLRGTEIAVLLIWGGWRPAGAGLGRSMKTALIATLLPAGAGILVLYMGKALFSLSLLPSGKGLSCLEAPTLALFLATACLLSPVAEELFFRGLLYRSMRERYGLGISLLAVSVLFALIHFWLSRQAFLPFLGGVIFCLGYEWTRTILTPILLHISGNLIIYLSPLLGFL